MKLNTIKISNLMSFGFLEDFENAEPTIKFENELNLLIGANGSGKSNFIEIITRLLQSHFLNQYTFDEGNMQTSHIAETIKLAPKNIGQNALSNHFDYPNNPSLIEVTFLLTSGDIEAAKFISTCFEQLSDLAKTYCKGETIFGNYNKIDADSLQPDNVIGFRFDFLNNEFKLVSKFKNQEEEFFYKYLYYYDQLQWLIYISNTHIGTNWKMLKNPFALISSMRTYSGILGGIAYGTDLGQKLNQNLQQQKPSTKNYTATDPLNTKIAIKIGQQMRSDLHKAGMDYAVDYSLKNEDSILFRINKILKANLNMTYEFGTPRYSGDNIDLILYQGDRSITHQYLSMGQRSIFYLIFAVIGLELENGLLIVDEPELHLHFSMQKKYFALLKDLCSEANIQIVLATHSGAFIDETTISSTYRFYKYEDKTAIISPGNIEHSEKDLVKILTYTNSSRIFFSDVVILVEGDSDEYFFNYFYKNHIRNVLQTEREVEIQYIGGKGNYKKWMKFLSQYRIDTFYIGDFDNVKEFELLQKVGVSYHDLVKNSKDHFLSKFFKEKIKTKETKDGRELLKQLDNVVNKNFILDQDDKDNLADLWKYLIQKQGSDGKIILNYLRGNSILQEKIELEIDHLYSKGVFILKQGALEDYLCISKDLQNVISFCESKFDNWILEKENYSKLKELEDIFVKILPTRYPNSN